VSDRTPFAHVLHDEMIAKLARGAAFERGRAYFADRRVQRLSCAAGRLLGQVVGTASYEVSIWVTGDRLGYACSCPAGREGDFCKHCVAIALAWVNDHR
jgi:uncharacterized Zn finger protein